MDYVIGNRKRNVYIKIDNGTPVKCTESEAQHFNLGKANNVKDNLPKAMRKYNCRVFAVPDDDPVKLEIKPLPESMRPLKLPRAEKCEAIAPKEEKKYIRNEDYEVPPEILQWAERVRNCNNLANDALKRREELLRKLSNIDKELSNVLHTIELERWKNGCDGYRYYKSVKDVLQRRRPIKDELMIVNSILESDLTSMAADGIDNMVAGLSNRRFEYRTIEDLD